MLYENIRDSKSNTVLPTLNVLTFKLFALNSNKGDFI